MKRTGNLFEFICERENLRLAFHKAVRGKRDGAEVLAFTQDLDDRLHNVQTRLMTGTFVVGTYRQFMIRDPKERIITAPRLEERIVHHAIMNVCEPVLERWLIDETFACRKGKGRIAAVQRAQYFARQYPYFLKIDIRKYFDSVSHRGLLERLRRRFKDECLLDLLEKIVNGFRGDLGVGLPIGSLTSQHFANFYLGWFDRFVKEQCRVRGYVRYMDDMVFWADDTAALKELLLRMDAFLDRELGLALKPTPYINRTLQGMEYLGCRIFPYHLLLTRTAKKRFRRKLRLLDDGLSQGDINESQYQQCAESLTAFTKAGGVRSWRFRHSVLEQREVKGP